MSNSISVTLGGSIELVLSQPAQGQVIVTAAYNGFTAKGTDMAYTLQDDKQITVRVDYVDAHGHPATIDGDVAWDTSSEEIASVTVDDSDSQKATVVAGSTLGTAQITATADADLGSGVRQVITTFAVSVVAGEAVTGVISPVGDPVPIG